MRSLVRRIQNHGYATMPRIADHLDSLTAGDESNAVLEALDAVNLMTVHASKGLEFPIVFVVNMAKGASGPPRPVRVTVDADCEGEQQASVTVGPFVSEMDEAERLREKHETKRLLYVALTRARDRLYLASALKDGVMVPGRGSLGEVLPQSMKDLFAQAAVSPGVARFSTFSHMDERVRYPFRVATLQQRGRKARTISAVRRCHWLSPGDTNCRFPSGPTDAPKGGDKSTERSSLCAPATSAGRLRAVTVAPGCHAVRDAR